MSAFKRSVNRIVLLTAVAFWCSPAIGQVRSHGYVFGGIVGGSFNATPHVQLGVGVDKVWSKGFGIGTEGGYVGSGRRGSDGGFWSFNLTQQFHRASSRIVPFATGGISVIYDAGGFNFGGGVLYPFRERLGLRLEFREHLVQSSCCDEVNALASFRIGLTFR